MLDLESRIFKPKTGRIITLLGTSIFFRLLQRLKIEVTEWTQYGSWLRTVYDISQSRKYNLYRSKYSSNDEIATKQSKEDLEHYIELCFHVNWLKKNLINAFVLRNDREIGDFNSTLTDIVLSLICRFEYKCFKNFTPIIVLLVNSMLRQLCGWQNCLKYLALSKSIDLLTNCCNT